VVDEYARCRIRRLASAGRGQQVAYKYRLDLQPPQPDPKKEKPASRRDGCELRLGNALPTNTLTSVREPCTTTLAITPAPRAAAKAVEAKPSSAAFRRADRLPYNSRAPSTISIGSPVGEAGRWTTISELEPAGNFTLLVTRVWPPSENVTVRVPCLTGKGPATLPPDSPLTTESPSRATEIVRLVRPCTM
jgi:hypothetical protein